MSEAQDALESTQLILEYEYRDSDESKLNSLISEFEYSFGGERKPSGGGGGAIDVVRYLELVVAFTGGVAATNIVGKYLEGLLGGDAIKEKGDQHRKVIEDWLSAIRFRFEQVIGQFGEMLHHSSLPDRSFNGHEQALALTIPIKNLRCYVVLNHRDVSDQLLSSLPQSIERMIRYIAETDIPVECHTAQLYFDLETGDWPFLFLPSVSSFLQFVDCVVDLRNGNIMSIESNVEFRDRFNPSHDDQYKFIISPFRDLE